jgi:hypothetical protein
VSNSKFRNHVRNCGHTVLEECICFVPHSIPATLVYSNAFCCLFSPLLHESSILLRLCRLPQHIRDLRPVRDLTESPSVLFVLHPGTQSQTEYRSGTIESFSTYLTTIFLPLTMQTYDLTTRLRTFCIGRELKF